MANIDLIQGNGLNSIADIAAGALDAVSVTAGVKQRASDGMAFGLEIIAVEVPADGVLSMVATVEVSGTVGGTYVPVQHYVDNPLSVEVLRNITGATITAQDPLEVVTVEGLPAVADGVEQFIRLSFTLSGTAAVTWGGTARVFALASRNTSRHGSYSGVEQ